MGRKPTKQKASAADVSVTCRNCGAETVSEERSGEKRVNRYACGSWERFGPRPGGDGVGIHAQYLCEAAAKAA